MRKNPSESANESSFSPGDVPHHIPGGSAVRLPSLPGRLEVLERLISEAIGDPTVNEYRERALFTFFCGAQPEEAAGYEGQLESVGRCLDWLVFDYHIPVLHATPGRHWFDVNTVHLTAIDYADIRDCLNFTLGIFEIAAVQPGRSFVALDLLRAGERYLVNEHVVSDEIEPGQLLVARLFPHRSAYILSGMAAVMDQSATEQINELIARGRIRPKEILSNLDGLELENLFGRGLGELENTDDLEMLYERLGRYVEETCPGRMTFEQVMGLIESGGGLGDLAADICRRMEIHCRHEAQLIGALVAAVRRNTRG